MGGKGELEKVIFLNKQSKSKEKEFFYLGIGREWGGGGLE